MEPAKIDWKRIESVFDEDNLYENINAPKWVDFLAPDDVSVDDEAWFCRPDCNHPKTAEDFLKTPPTSKLPRLLERLPFGDRNQRDARLMKRGGQSQSQFPSNVKPNLTVDSENQNPNSFTTHNQSMKSAIKSSIEKTKLMNDNTTSENDEVVAVPRLKTTLSARNLFAGRDILNHITDFCNELKKLATRAKEKETVENLNEKKNQVDVKKEVVNDSPGEVLGELDGRQKERKPLLEADKENLQGGSVNGMQKKKRFDEAENIPVSLNSGNAKHKAKGRLLQTPANPPSLNLENVKHKGEERLLQIRTNPPSPQCFSAPRAAAKITPSKASILGSTERKILQEVVQNKEVRKEEPADKARNVSTVDGREPRALDVFWFLKPCTLSS